jgi:hypothetical protein
MEKMGEGISRSVRELLLVAENQAGPENETASLVRVNVKLDEGIDENKLPLLPEPALRFDRYWEMPNRYTFFLDSVKQLLKAEMIGLDWVDPFSGKYSPASVRNDCDTTQDAEFHLDGIEFLERMNDEKRLFDGALFDPPYSTEQALRSYKAKFQGTAGREEYHSRCKDELARIIKPGGKAICFGWTSAGLGINRGFSLERIMLVCHGAAHYDTIVTVERKWLTQKMFAFE